MFEDNNEDSEVITPISCAERQIDLKWESKIIIYSQDDVVKDNFRDPKSLYSMNAFGDYVYFKTNKPSVAREWSDEIFGKNKYDVRKVILLAVR